MKTLVAFLDTLPLPAAIAHRDGFFEYVNPAWERVTGWSVGDLTGKPYIEFVHPDDVLKTATEHLELHHRGSGVVDAFVNRYRCQNGGYVQLAWRSIEWGDDDKTVAVAQPIGFEAAPL
jgi:PAS domain S-box-containing protein